ncbi:MAG: hypothetical protein ACRC62_14695 [Microcoleus sp.]
MGLKIYDSFAIAIFSQTLVKLTAYRILGVRLGTGFTNYQLPNLGFESGVTDIPWLLNLEIKVK